ncbi:NADAR family protein [Yersinia ruckeri]|nr:NADAR family protein [Yersinia ruckeri]
MFDPVSGVTFPTVEYWMMWHKAQLFTVPSNQKSSLFASRITTRNYEIMTQILKAKDSGEVKALGRKVEGYQDSIWHAHRKDIVKKGCYLKLGFCDEALYFLLSLDPKNDRLCEASKYDRDWGVGFEQSDPRINDLSLWGLNLLGDIWQEIMIELHTTPAHELRLPSHVVEKIVEHTARYSRG